MTDRSRLAVGRHVSYLPTAADEPAVEAESWAAQIIASDRTGFTLLIRRPNGEPLVRQDVSRDRIAPAGIQLGMAAEAPTSTAYPYDETLHFNERRQVAGVTLATPTVLSADAMSFWGTINVYKDMQIVRSHIHQIVDGGTGSTDAEVWRRRGLAGPFTHIIDITLAAGGGDFGFAQGLPFDDAAAILERGDYLYLQLTARPSGPASEGLLVDVHMENR